MRQIADKQNSYLMCDMAHISGIVAAQLCNNPFEFCDVVTTTTHKTLRGPRSGIIFYRKGKRIVAGKEIGEYDIAEKIDNAVFPSCQGGPHENVIGAVAVALKEASQPEFVEYVKQLLKNSKILAEELMKKGYTLQSGGTDNHLVLWNVRASGITGSKLEKLFELASITVNKNSVFGDTSAAVPGGIRLGTPALTTRGLKEDDFRKVADFLHRGFQIAISVQNTIGGEKAKLVDFVEAIQKNAELPNLRNEVETFAKQFPLPG